VPGTRIVFKVDETQAAGLPSAVADLLESAGAVQVRKPHPDLPGVYVAMLGPDVDVDALLASLLRAPGILDAERDDLQSAF
jgi:hypothetical protein